MLILAMGSLVVFLVMVHLIIGRTCRENRSVLLQMPIEEAWASIRDFGALHAAHGRGRPLTVIDSSTLVRGDGLTPGSIWIQKGHWDGGRFWSEIELIESEAPHRLVVALRRDSFGTQAGLTRHRCALELSPFDGRTTRLRLRLTARLSNLRLVLMRTLSPERMQARLLDLGLRSAKLAFEGAGVAAAEPAASSFPAAAAQAAPFAQPSPILTPTPVAAMASVALAVPRTMSGTEPAAARPLPAMLPEWIKPEVAAAFSSLRSGSSRAWAGSTEGALDQS